MYHKARCGTGRAHVHVSEVWGPGALHTGARTLSREARVQDPAQANCAGVHSCELDSTILSYRLRMAMRVTRTSVEELDRIAKAPTVGGSMDPSSSC